MLNTLKNILSPDPLHAQAHEAYVMLVSQARKPMFYRDWQVPDSIDGRFDMIVLHMYLVLARCQEEERDARAAAFARTLSETFFSDMDRSLREMGASDTGVGKRVKNMAQAFYGRMKAYEYATTTVELQEALRRNVWRDHPPADASVAALASYIERNKEYLRDQLVHMLGDGRITFRD